VKSVLVQHPEIARAERVLECGSYNINGSVRGLFHAAEYIGIDYRDGPGVDTVAFAHEYADRPAGYFDVAISTEMLEHDPHWRESLAGMARLLRPGGAMVVTCAGPGRREHHPECSPDGTYYRNLSPGDLAAELTEAAGWTNVRFEQEVNHHDTYALAFRNAQPWGIA